MRLAKCHIVAAFLYQLYFPDCHFTSPLIPTPDQH